MVWKGKLPRELLDIAQQGYVSTEAMMYPKDLEIIDCGLGTNPLGMPKALHDFLDGMNGFTLCDYPTPEPDDLKKAIALRYKAWNILPEQILVGSGSMGVLINLARLFLGPRSVFSGISPQFTDTILHAIYTGASYHPVHLVGPRFRIDMDRLLEAIGKSPALFYLDRPNNPTGQVLPLGHVEQLARAGMEKGVWIISDEAYGDFIPDEESAASLDCPNLVTCRTFSKGRGAAGIRVGFAITRDPDLASLFRIIQPPFAVGTLDAAMAMVALGDKTFLEETRRYVRTAKSKIMETIGNKLDWSVADTDLRVPILLLSQKTGDLVRRLAASGISCEAGTGFFGLDNRSLRLRVPAPNQLDDLLKRMARA